MAPGTAHRLIVERDPQLAALSAALAEAVAGNGRVVLVDAPPGMGKTTLLQTLLDGASPGGATATRVLHARGGEQERGLPMAVVRELFHPLAALPHDDEVWTGAAALARPVLAHGPVADPAGSAYGAVHGLYWLTANLTASLPLVLVVDDAHWLDEGSEAFLAHLVPRLHELPVLLVLATRSRALDPARPLAGALARCPDLIVVSPPALTPSGTAMVLAELAVDGDREFGLAVHRATAGNPLLVRTVAEGVRAAGRPPTPPGSAAVEVLGMEHVARAVLPRLHAEGSDAVALARAVALLGDGCALHDAAAVGQVELAAAERALDRLVTADVLRRGGRGLEFSHPLVRAAVLDELGPGARHRWHRAAAAHLHRAGSPAEQVARHLVDTGPVHEEWAVDTLVAAASVATARGVPAAATTFLERALTEIGPEDPRRTPVLLELGWAGMRAGDPRAHDWLVTALGEASDPVLWTVCWLALGNLIAVRQLDSPPDRRLDGRPPLGPDQQLAVTALTKLDFGIVSDGIYPAPPFPPPDRPPPGDSLFQRLWLVAEAVCTCMAATSAGTATDLVQRATADGQLLREAPDFPHTAWAAWVLGLTGELDGSLVLVETCVADAVTRGSVAAFEWLVLARAAVHWMRGELRECEADVRRALDEDVETGIESVRPLKHAILASTLREQGRLDEGSASYAAVPPAVLDRRSLFGLLLRESRARLLAARGSYREALADVAVVEEVLTAWGFRDSAFLRWREVAARCRWALGEESVALALADAELEAARRFGAPPRLGAALATRGTMTAGPDGVALLREAVAVLDGSGARLGLAHALVALGARLRQDRDIVAAREALRRALDVSTACGATAVAQTAVEELRASGARPRRRAVTGPAALTPSELRIARMAADGLTNSQIAQSLFVTRKTVEKHLAGAFLKLGVSGRGELANVLGPHASDVEGHPRRCGAGGGAAAGER